MQLGKQSPNTGLGEAARACGVVQQRLHFKQYLFQVFNRFFSTNNFRCSTWIFFNKNHTPEIEHQHVIKSVHAFGFCNVFGCIRILASLQRADGRNGTREALCNRVPGISYRGIVAGGLMPVQIKVDSIVTPISSTTVGKDGFVCCDFLKGKKASMDEDVGQLCIDRRNGSVRNLFFCETSYG